MTSKITKEICGKAFPKKQINQQLEGSDIASS